MTVLLIKEEYREFQSLSTFRNAISHLQWYCCFTGNGKNDW